MEYKASFFALLTVHSSHDQNICTFILFCMTTWPEYYFNYCTVCPEYCFMIKTFAHLFYFVWQHVRNMVQCVRNIVTWSKHLHIYFILYDNMSGKLFQLLYSVSGILFHDQNICTFILFCMTTTTIKLSNIQHSLETIIIYTNIFWNKIHWESRLKSISVTFWNGSFWIIVRFWTPIRVGYRGRLGKLKPISNFFEKGIFFDPVARTMVDLSLRRSNWCIINNVRK